MDAMPAGNPWALAASAAAWTAFGEEVIRTKEAIDAAVEATKEQWTGSAADAFYTWWEQRSAALYALGTECLAVAGVFAAEVTPITTVNTAWLAAATAATPFAPGIIPWALNPAIWTNPGTLSSSLIPLFGSSLVNPTTGEAAAAALAACETAANALYGAVNMSIGMAAAAVGTVGASADALLGALIVNPPDEGPVASTEALAIGYATEIAGTLAGPVIGYAAGKAFKGVKHVAGKASDALAPVFKPRPALKGAGAGGVKADEALNPADAGKVGLGSGAGGPRAGEALKPGDGGKPGLKSEGGGRAKGDGVDGPRDGGKADLESAGTTGSKDGGVDGPGDGGDPNLAQQSNEATKATDAGAPSEGGRPKLTQEPDGQGPAGPDPSGPDPEAVVTGAAVTAGAAGILATAGKQFGKLTAPVTGAVDDAGRWMKRWRNRLKGRTNVVTDADFSSSVETTSGATLNSTGKVRVKFEVGGSREAFWKPHDLDGAPAHKAVASSRLARWLGLDDLIARNKFAEVNGQIGAISGRVEGRPLYRFELDEVDMAQRYPDVLPAKWDELAARDKLVKQGDKYFVKTEQVFQSVDLSHPKVQKELHDLQLFDAITGQWDRHGGNVYVQVDRHGVPLKVTGIDDDQAFPRVAPGADVEGGSNYNTGLPSLVDHRTAEKILRANPDDLDKVLTRPGDPITLSPGEIARAKERLAMVQRHVQRLKDEGKLVKKWNDETFWQAMTEAPRQGFQRTYRPNYVQARVDDLLTAEMNDPGLAGVPTRLEGMDAPNPPLRQPAPADGAPTAAAPAGAVPDGGPPAGAVDAPVSSRGVDEPMSSRAVDDPVPGRALDEPPPLEEVVPTAPVAKQADGAVTSAPDAPAFAARAGDAPTGAVPGGQAAPDVPAGVAGDGAPPAAAVDAPVSSRGVDAPVSSRAVDEPVPTGRVDSPPLEEAAGAAPIGKQADEVAAGPEPVPTGQAAAEAPSGAVARQADQGVSEVGEAADQAAKQPSASPVEQQLDEGVSVEEELASVPLARDVDDQPGASAADPLAGDGVVELRKADLAEGAIVAPDPEAVAASAAAAMAAAAAAKAAVVKPGWFHTLGRKLRTLTGRTNVLGPKDIKEPFNEGVAGTFNTAHTTATRTPLGGRFKDAFFKPRTETAPAENAVAASRLARALGLGDLIARNKFARFGDTTGVISGKVDGQPLVSFKWIPVDVKQEQIPKEAFESTEAFVNYAKREGWKLEKDKKWYKKGPMLYQKVDFTDPRVQKGLHDLQLFDAITGQSDRHGGNIYVTPDGKITGIDDDWSFGWRFKTDDPKFEVEDYGVPLNLWDQRVQKYPGLPKLVDEGTAEKVLALKPADLDKILRRWGDPHPLADEAILVAEWRLGQVQQYLRQLQAENKLVKEWGPQTYRAAVPDIADLREFNPFQHTTSYLQEQVYQYQKAARHGRGLGSHDAEVVGEVPSPRAAPDVVPPAPAERVHHPGGPGTTDAVSAPLARQGDEPVESVAKRGSEPLEAGAEVPAGPVAKRLDEPVGAGNGAPVPPPGKQVDEAGRAGEEAPVGRPAARGDEVAEGAGNFVPAEPRVRAALEVIEQEHRALAEGVKAHLKAKPDVLAELDARLSLQGKSWGTSAEQRSLVRAALLAYLTVGKRPLSSVAGLQKGLLDKSVPELKRILGRYMPADVALDAKGVPLPGRTGLPAIGATKAEQKAWRPSVFTKPAQHRADKFRYVVIALQNHTKDSNRAYKYNDFLDNPGILENFVNSTSVIDQTHKGTYSPYGYILDVPESNFAVASRKDVALANQSGDVEFEIEKKHAELGLPPPEEILKGTKFESNRPRAKGDLPYNEVVVRGRTGQGIIKPKGIFVKTIDGKLKKPINPTTGKAAPDPYVSEELLWRIRETAGRQQIPIVHIDEGVASDKVQTVTMARMDGGLPGHRVEVRGPNGEIEATGIVVRTRDGRPIDPATGDPVDPATVDDLLERAKAQRAEVAFLDEANPDNDKVLRPWLDADRAARGTEQASEHAGEPVERTVERAGQTTAERLSTTLDPKKFKQATPGLFRDRSAVVEIDGLLERYAKLGGTGDGILQRAGLLDELLAKADAYKGSRVEGVQKLRSAILEEQRFMEPAAEAVRLMRSSENDQIKAGLRRLWEAQDTYLDLTRRGHQTRVVNWDALHHVGLDRLKQDRAKVMAELALEDVAALETLAKSPDVDDLTKRLLDEALANKQEAKFQETLTIASGAVLNDAKTEENPATYIVSLQFKQAQGTDERLSSLLHELTHVSVQSTFHNSPLHLAIKQGATDAEIIELCRKRTQKLNALARILKEKPPRGLSQEQLEVFANKIAYPTTKEGRSTLGGYVALFRGKMDPTLARRLDALWDEGHGPANNTLVEYDTVVNQMLFLADRWKVPRDSDFYRTLHEMAEEAYGYRLAARQACTDGTPVPQDGMTHSTSPIHWGDVQVTRSTEGIEGVFFVKAGDDTVVVKPMRGVARVDFANEFVRRMGFDAPETVAYAKDSREFKSIAARLMTADGVRNPKEVENQLERATHIVVMNRVEGRSMATLSDSEATEFAGNREALKAVGRLMVADAFMGNNDRLVGNKVNLGNFFYSAGSAGEPGTIRTIDNDAAFKLSAIGRSGNVGDDIEVKRSIVDGLLDRTPKNPSEPGALKREMFIDAFVEEFVRIYRRDPQTNILADPAQEQAFRQAVSDGIDDGFARITELFRNDINAVRKIAKSTEPDLEHARDSGAAKAIAHYIRARVGDAPGRGLSVERARQQLNAYVKYRHARNEARPGFKWVTRLVNDVGFAHA